MSNLIDRYAAIDLLKTETELLKRVLDDTDAVRNEREKITWGLELIELFIDDIKELPSAEPPTRCIAEIKLEKKVLEELVNEKIEEIKEIKSENEDFLNFLFNVINPNDMEEYLAMYNSQGEAEG